MKDDIELDRKLAHRIGFGVGCCATSIVGMLVFIGWLLS